MAHVKRESEIARYLLIMFENCRLKTVKTDEKEHELINIVTGIIKVLRAISSHTDF